MPENQQVSLNAETLQKIAGTLQQRIGQLVSQYETDISVLRASFEDQLQSAFKQINDLQEELNQVKDTDVPKEAKEDPVRTKNT